MSSRSAAIRLTSTSLFASFPCIAYHRDQGPCQTALPGHAPGPRLLRGGLERSSLMMSQANVRRISRANQQKCAHTGAHTAGREATIATLSSFILVKPVNRPSAWTPRACPGRVRRALRAKTTCLCVRTCSPSSLCACSDVATHWSTMSFRMGRGRSDEGEVG